MHRWRSVLIAGGLMLSACTPEFSHGVVDTPLPNDPRLLGDWIPTDSQYVGKGVALVTAAGPNQIRVSGIDFPTCHHDDGFAAARAEIAGRDFLQLVSVDDKTAKPDDDATPIFVAYSFDAKGQLQFFLPNDAVFRNAVEQHQIAGSVRPDHWNKMQRDTLVTASTPMLRAYLAAHPEAMTPAPEEMYAPLVGAIPFQCGK